MLLVNSAVSGFHVSPAYNMHSNNNYKSTVTKLYADPVAIDSVYAIPFALGLLPLFIGNNNPFVDEKAEEQKRKKVNKEVGDVVADEEEQISSKSDPIVQEAIPEMKSETTEDEETLVKAEVEVETSEDNNDNDSYEFQRSLLEAQLKIGAKDIATKEKNDSYQFQRALLEAKFKIEVENTVAKENNDYNAASKEKNDSYQFQRYLLEARLKIEAKDIATKEKNEFYQFQRSLLEAQLKMEKSLNNVVAAKDEVEKDEDFSSSNINDSYQFQRALLEARFKMEGQKTTDALLV